MMRFILIIFLFSSIGFACVKPKTKDPIPVISYEALYHLQKSEFTNSDTALLSITYEDGDGDLFLDNNSQGPNVVFIPFFMNTTTHKFDVTINPITLDTQRIEGYIKQPDNGYYKGKSIKGNIYLPMNQFRPNDNAKIIKFTGYVMDIKGHKSNIVASPVYTLNF